MKIKTQKILWCSMVCCAVFVFGITIGLTNKPTTLSLNIEAMSDSEGPGNQGQRQQQIVMCETQGTLVFVAGCCFGAESCMEMNPCNGYSFSCDGNNWIEVK